MLVLYGETSIGAASFYDSVAARCRPVGRVSRHAIPCRCRQREGEKRWRMLSFLPALSELATFWDNTAGRLSDGIACPFPSIPELA